MPQVTISNSTLERLKRYAEPFVDTEDIVINRVLDRLESSNKQSVFNEADKPGNSQIDREPVKRAVSVAGGKSENFHQIDPDDLPDLTHAKVQYAKIDKEPIRKGANWNGTLDRMLCYAYKRAGVGTFDELLKISPVNIREGSKLDEGYHYLPEVNISVQGVSANQACRAIVDMAAVLGISVDIEIEWRRKEGAAYPGQRGRLFMQGRTEDSE